MPMGIFSRGQYCQNWLAELSPPDAGNSERYDIAEPYWVEKE